MTAPAPPAVDPRAAREAVRVAGARFSTLLRSVRSPEAPALGKWNVRELATHVSTALDGISAVLEGGTPMLPDVWQLSTLTEMLVVGEETTDLPALADRVDASVARYVARSESLPPDDRRTWLVVGTEVNLATVTCHILNELLVHGRDIAKADGGSWTIDRPSAALVIGGFLFPVLGQLGGSMVEQKAAAGRRVGFDVNVRGGSRAYFVFDNGDLTVTTSRPSRPVDCHLSVDPTAFLLVAWGRISQGPAIARGQLFAWGRKPWLGLQLRSLMRNP